MTDNLTPAALRRAVDELSPEKRALLSLRLAGRRTAANSVPRLPRTGGVERFPASAGQQRLYFAHQLDPAATTYLLPFMVRLKGKLRPDALAAAWQATVDRHEILRTGFEVDAVEGLLQVVRPAGSVDLSLAVQEIHADDVLAHVTRLTTEPFDPSIAPLARAALWRLQGAEDDEWVLALCVHHIVVDGWSIGVLVDELVRTYTEFVTLTAPSLQPLPVQYADFAHWQREWLAGDVARGQLDYWREVLADARPLLLPTDRPRFAGRTTNSAAVPLPLDHELITELESLARSEQATTFMVLLAAVCAVLSRWSGQDDVVVATPVAGRPVPEVDRLVGFFVNTLPLRVKLAAAATFRELLRRSRTACLAAYEHQDVPVERIVQSVGGARRGGRSDLLTVMLALRNVPVGAIQLPEVDAEVADLPTAGTEFDLTLEFTPDSSGNLRGWLVYSTDLFDPATAERIAAGVHEMLRAAVTDPDIAAHDLPVMPAAEHARLVGELSGQAVTALAERPLLAWFDDHVAATPSATAVIAGGTVTFAELDERANRLAHWLRRAGIGVEDKVAVCLARDLDLVVSLLAVLKAGAVFVPLEVDQPAERIRRLAADARPALVLTNSSIAAGLDLPARTIPLDLLDVSTHRSDRADVPVSELNAAYVLYTSGSTGTPKGVVITRQGLTNRVRGMCTEFGFDRTDKVLHRTPMSADTAMWELLVSLFCGGELVVAEPGRHNDAAYLFDTMARHEITTCFFVPSALRLLLATPGFDTAARTLRLLICAGEELPAELSEKVLALAPGTMLINSYGPTETTINVAEHQVTTPVPASVPIGRPVPGADLYVLDDTMRVQPAGVPGDLFAGGVQLARGYLAKPGQTAQAYVPHPFQPGKRLYRTGDRARWRTDGVLEFLGRTDNQVKIRGYRVELGEVEAALRGHPEVLEAVVLAKPGPRSELRLAAYLTTDGGRQLSAGSLRGHLVKLLPTPMIPSAFVVMDSFPVTTYGKVDRAALPEPEGGQHQAEVTRVAPSDGLQEVLAAVWTRVLDVTDIGVHDDFFVLGGQSLLATLVVAQVRDLFRLELPLHFFVDAPSIAELAALLRSQGGRQGVDVDRVARLILQVERMSEADVESALTDPAGA